MRNRWLWFPAAVVVAVVIGVVLGLLSGGSDDPDDSAGPTSTTSVVTTTTEPAEGGEGADATTTTAAPTTTQAPVEIEFSTVQGWNLLAAGDDGAPVLQPVGEQTALLVADFDGDGTDDMVVGSRRAPNAVQLVRTVDGQFVTTVVEPDELGVEAGGTAYDVDADGDLDIVFGGDFSSQEVWWWENPAPALDSGRWTRHLIKSDGGPMHHDMVFANIDGEGRDELVFWNQRSETPTLWAATIPADPTGPDQWQRVAVWFGTQNSEGVDSGDVEGDGDIDLVAAGTLLENDGTGRFRLVEVAPDLAGGRARMADLVDGGNLELVFDSGDGTGPTVWFEWDGQTWARNVLRETTSRGHSLDIADADGDGDLDVLSGEMRLDASDDARLTVFENQGDGSFAAVQLSRGIDNHESKFADVDGDGDIDIVTKPFNWQVPRLDIWLNEQVSGLATGWTRHVVDGARPARAVFVLPGDIDGDGDADLVSGPWWYNNPGTAGGEWTRQPIGEPLNQAAVVYDFDGDGDLDVFGSQGVGSETNADLAWAQNDGTGAFSVFTNVAAGTGDFLQGATAGQFQPDAPAQVLLSWHEAGRGIQSFSPSNVDNITARWTRSLTSETSQDEQITAADIDGDGALDVMLGNMWLENRPGAPAHTLHQPSSGTPDRHKVIDMDGDGDLDVVVSYEDAENGRIAWYEQPDDPTSLWTEHPIADLTMPLSLDAADLDGDGDIDVVAGEHSTTDPTSMSLMVYENGGDNDTWLAGTLFTGDEHHDGAVLVDVDGDGDLDIASIGWTHGRVLVYENPGA